jgi:hypothetical protein
MGNTLSPEMKTMPSVIVCFRTRLALGRAAVLAALVMTGCVTPTALRPPDVAKVNRTHVRVYLPQDQLRAQHIQSSYGVTASFMAYHSAEIGQPEGANAIPLWTKDNGAAFRQAVSEGAEANAKLISYV